MSQIKKTVAATENKDDNKIPNTTATPKTLTPTKNEQQSAEKKNAEKTGQQIIPIKTEQILAVVKALEKIVSKKSLKKQKKESEKNEKTITAENDARIKTEEFEVVVKVLEKVLSVKQLKKRRKKLKIPTMKNCQQNQMKINKIKKVW